MARPHQAAPERTAISAAATVFELMPGGQRSWKESLHSFDGSEGSAPSFNVVSDAAGNLYGTTFAGGVYGNGTVFEN